MSVRYLAVVKWLVFAFCLTCAQVAWACDAAARGVGILSPRTNLSHDQKIGKKKSGLMCLPAGSWYWKDVGFDAEAEANGIIETLRLQRISVQQGAEFGADASSSELRLRASILNFSMDGCVPWALTRGLGGGKPFRGAGSIEVRWELYSASLERVVWEFTQRTQLEASPTAKGPRDFFRSGLLTATETMAGELNRFCHQ